MPLIRKDPAGPPLSGTGNDQRTALMGGSADERWVAVRALSRVPDSAGLLGEALTKESDPRVREAIFTALVGQKSAHAVQVILPCLRSDEAAIRTGALDALSAMPEMAPSYLPALLDDVDSDIRILCCEIARKLPAELATRLLCEMLEREEVVNVCAAAVEVLSEVGEPDALPVLRKCAERFSGAAFLVFAIDIASKRIDEGRARAAKPS
jgi:HEAT repeat protein